MKQVISSERLPIKMWLDDIEEGALDQAKDLANLPFAFKHIAIMPDSHQGYGMPIGAVLATDINVIVPNAVGVDIGCGMGFVETSLMVGDVSETQMKDIMGEIRDRVPVGFNQHSERQKIQRLPDRTVPYLSVIQSNFGKSLYQIGTLGGGNHFIELQEDVSKGNINIMIHSGSRKVGFEVAKFYHEKAKERNAMYHSTVPKDLAFLVKGDNLYKEYLNEMSWCVEYARLNRALMMDRVIESIRNVVDKDTFYFSDIKNKPHNFADMENHYGKNVMVHRKGATRARNGEFGMIPGSQGSYSYIVEGLGNPESFDSCSHGAGRLMSRTKAKNGLSMEDEIKQLEEMGVLHSIRNESDLDEAPSAYKNIEEVMENQKDLVKIKRTLKPLAVIKG